MIGTIWRWLLWLFFGPGHHCIAGDPTCTEENQCVECWESWLW